MRYLGSLLSCWLHSPVSWLAGDGTMWDITPVRVFGGGRGMLNLRYDGCCLSKEERCWLGCCLREGLRT